jgi:ABC-type transporter Mla MlaB component
MAKSQSITLKAQASKAKGKTDEVVLLMQGDLTLDNAPKVKEFFLNSMSKGKAFNVRISNVDNIDLGFLQLLKRFCWDAQHEQKAVDIAMNISDDQKLLLTRSGFGSVITLTS